MSYIVSSELDVAASTNTDGVTVVLGEDESLLLDEDVACLDEDVALSLDEDVFDVDVLKFLDLSLLASGVFFLL
ncbi:unnamed protein product [[Candida] boidinii]|uniref:Unnamed protein product n=1 Tax=Candida boidinii TaxID=5477 RepID=A0A9W6T0V9_CANBO|nr:unnamed protein product [[Candida] boidinii]GMF83137.1 unnamed protein product [[Candida] boidinii]